MVDSAILRKNLLNARNNLSIDEVMRKSAAVKNNFLNLDVIDKAKNFFIYVSFRSEVETLTLINTLLSMGKHITVPITRVKEKRLDAITITDPAKDLVPGYCNIPEPSEELCLHQKARPEDIEVIVLPGSVFDERGGRFGYGGGYYDRFVSSIPKALRVGFAFDLQIVPQAPLQAHDEILDLVITETKIINGSR